MEEIAKSNKGITLLALTVYIAVILIIIGLMASLRGFFFNNVSILQNSARYADSFDNFNSNFVKDVKSSKHAVIDGNTIIFDNGAVYNYNQDDKGVYRNKIKIATNVNEFSATNKTIIVKGTTKELVVIKIGIGDSQDMTFYKNISYTLKYW